MTGHYKLAGRILILPIAGSGYIEGNYSKYIGGTRSVEFSSNSLQEFFTNGCLAHRRAAAAATLIMIKNWSQVLS
jgi:hypothetical protein